MATTAAVGVVGGKVAGGSEFLTGSKPGAERSERFTPEQMDVLRQLNESTGGRIQEFMGTLGYDLEGNTNFQQGQGALPSQLAAFDPEQTSNAFEQYIGNPARQSFQEEYIPGIQERYVGKGGGRSSAAELMATQGATKLETNLAGRKSQTLLDAERQREQIRQGAISQSLQYAQAPQQSQQSDFDRFLQSVNLGFTPAYDTIVNPGSPGILPSLISAAGSAAGAAASSREIKENIKDFDGGLDLIKEMEVKKYSYIEGVEETRTKHIGLIAEDMPKEIQKVVKNVLHVDVYGLLAISINAIKELSRKVEALESR